LGKSLELWTLTAPPEERLFPRVSRSPVSGVEKLSFSLAAGGSRL
jgi:hypothetical protein